MKAESCSVCHRGTGPFRVTVYGDSVCNYCHRYFEARGINPHGRKPKPLLHDIPLWKGITLRFSAIQEAIRSKTPILNEYYLYSYPPDWDVRCALAKQRDGGMCSVSSCRKSNRLLVHHKKPLGRGGLHFLENLVTLCEECHIIEHPFIPEKIENQKQAKLEILCPTHSMPMRRAKIVWGMLSGPLPNDDNIIYGGCCIRLDDAGREISFGYICEQCEGDPQHPNPYFVLENGRPVALNE